MPVYEYECVSCRQRFEKARAINFRDRPAYCPECGHGGKKLISSPSLQKNAGTKLRKRLDKKKPPNR